MTSRVWATPHKPYSTLSVHLFDKDGNEISGGGYEPFVETIGNVFLRADSDGFSFSPGVITWEFAGKIDGARLWRDRGKVFGAAIYIDDQYFSEIWLKEPFRPMTDGDRFNLTLRLGMDPVS